MAIARLTGPTVAVLEVLLSATREEPVWGYRISAESGLFSGTTYPILARLLKCGWVESWPETEPAPGRPPRKFYRLTGTGRLAADTARQERLARLARNRLRTGRSASH